jgi:molybdate transport system substrate-binding protein
MGAADGMVEVGGGAENVRLPRLPELKPPPMRASALDARNPIVAATIATVVTARKIVRNMKSSSSQPCTGLRAQFDRNTDTPEILVRMGWLTEGGACCRTRDSTGLQSRQRITEADPRRAILYISTSIATAADRCTRAQMGGNAMKQTTMTAAAVGFAIMLAANIPASSAEIKVISSNALKTTLEQLAPAFEKSTEHKLVFTWGAAVPLKAEIERGATFDLAVLTTAAIDDLIRQGKLVGATRAVLATSGAGVAVRKGAAKPDISSVDAFKQALLNAKSVAYVEQGGTGIYLKELLQRLGIADALKDKVKRLPPENPAAHAVANGEAEIGMTQISEILPYVGAELVGPFPREIQLTTSFATAVGASAQQSEAANALIKFLTAPAAAPVFRAKGLDPAG